MARTKDQSFVNRYLNQYQSNQQAAVSAGQQAASSAANSGVSTMTQAAQNTKIPSLYDYAPDLMEMVVDQQEAQIKAQQAAAKAAQKQAEDQAAALEKAREEKAKEQKKALQSRQDAIDKAKENAELLGQTYMGGTASPSYYGPVWEGEVGASAPVMGNIPNTEYNENLTLPEVESDWVWTGHKWERESDMTDDQRAQHIQDMLANLNYQDTQNGKNESVSYDDAMLAYSTAAKNAQEISAQRAELEKEREKLANKVNDVGNRTAADISRFDAVVKELESLDSQEAEANANADTAMKAVKASIKELPEAQRLQAYMQPGYTMDKEEKSDAKAIMDSTIEQVPGLLWEEYAASHPAQAKQIQEGKSGFWVYGLSDKYRGQPIAEIYNSYKTMSDAEKQLGKSLSLFNSGETGAALAAYAGFLSAIPAFEDLADNANEATAQYLGIDESVKPSEYLSNLQQNDPLAYGAGMIGGTLAEYAAGAKLMNSIPGVSTGLQKAGQAIGNTRVAQALTNTPILGRAFTPAAITDILGDQAVDTVLDTGVSAARSAMQGEDPAQIAQDAAKNFGTNLAWNIGSAGVLGTAGDWLAQRRAARQAANAAQDAPLPAIDDAARQAAETVQEAPAAVNDAPQTLVEKWRSGTLTNADIETLKPSGQNRDAFEAETGIQLPSTSSETRRFFKQGSQNLNSTYAERVTTPSLSEPVTTESIPNSGYAEEANLEVPSQSRAVNSVDKRYLSEIDIDNQGGQRQYTHQRISHEEQLKRAENIRQTESDDEIISRIANAQNAGNSMSAEDSVTLGNIIKDMTKKLDSLDDTTEEYLILSRRKLYAQDVWQSGFSDAGRTLETAKMFTTPEKSVMQAQGVISRTVDSMKNAHGKEFGKLEDVVKKAVEDAEQSAEQAAKKELSAAQRLANRVSQTVPSNSASKIDPNAQVLNSMVNELFGVAKESPLPQAVKNSKSLTAADKIKLAYENADQYRETWEQAKAIVADKFANNEDALYLLDSYLKNLGDGGLYSAKTVSRAVGDAAKELNIDFKKLAKQYSIDKDAAIQSLTDKLISDVGVDGADAAELADRVMVAYNQQMQQAVEANLRAKFPELFGSAHSQQKQQAVDNFMQLLNMGVYNNDTVKQLVASKYGIAPLSAEQAGQIQAIMEKAQQFPQKSMERWELQNQAAAIAAENIDTSLLDKWNAWRYMSMLGNFNTWNRNSAGNVGQGTLARAKEFVQGAFYEPVADAISKAVKGEGIQRTTAVMNPVFNESDRALLSAGLLDADTSVYSDLVGNSELFDITKQIGRNKRVFKNEAFERARKGISAALEGADYSGTLGTLDFIKEISPKGSRLRDMAESVQEWGKQLPGFAGLRNNYAWSLAEYLKANNVGTEIFEATDEASQKLLMDARAWAVKQALENTYHEQAVVSDIINGAIKKLMDAKKPSTTVAAMALQGVLPFTKTPANVFKQAVRYSPAGFAKAVFPNVGAYAKQVGKWVSDKNLRSGGMNSLVEFLKLTEKADLSESLDAASKATVGTTLVALGAWLRANGVLTASMDDQEKAAASSTGQQEYALNWENEDRSRGSYTIDWLSSVSLPLFIGAEFYDSMVENGEGVGNAVASAYTAMLDPLTEMSFLSSVNNILDTYNRVNQSEDSEALAAGAALLTAGTSYFTQGIPTIGGQLARAVDDTRRSTYSDSTGVRNSLDYQLTQAENRILGLSMTNQPYIDQWGQEEKNTGGNFIGRLAFNMFSPGYYASAEYDPTISDLESLDSASAFPKTYPSKTVTYRQNGEDVTRRWTPEEYTQYSQALGQGSKDLADALTSDDAFAGLPSEEQLALVSDIYSMANRSARRDVVPYLNDEFLAAVESGDMKKEQRLDYIYEEQGAAAVVPYLVADQIIGGITGDKNAKGNTISGSAKKNKINALIEKGFTRAEAEELYELLNG